MIFPRDEFQWLNWGETGVLVLVLLALAILGVRRFRRELLRWTLALMSVQVATTIVYGWLLWRWFHADTFRLALIHGSKQLFTNQFPPIALNVALGWVAAIALGAVAVKWFVQKTKEIFLDRQDVALLILGMGAVGWPATFVFLAVVFALSVLAMIGLVIIRRKKLTDRLIVTPYIIPAAIITLVFRDALLHATYLWKLGF